MNPKTTIISVGVAIAIGVVLYVALFSNKNEELPPIVDPTCGPGYVLVGEGCITLREECDLRGDDYVFAESAQACIKNDMATSTSDTMQVKIVLLNTTGEGSGKSRGCDTVNMVTRTVPRSSAVLDAALKALFAEPEGSQPDTAYNFIARTKSTLKYDRATITSGTANIYLTGSLSGLAGVCDDPRAQAQIEETALQFGTVQKVQIYLNGNATNLMPSQQ